MSNETIVWKCVDEEMPDDGLDVLLKTNCASYPVWIGSHDSDTGWAWCDGTMPLYEVTHWAEMLEGPTQAKPDGEGALADAD